MMKCMAEGCLSCATKQAHMKIYVEGFSPKSMQPIHGEFEVYCCDEHATDDAGKNLLNRNEEAKRALEQQFEAARVRKPDWHISRVVWANLPAMIHTH